MMYVDAADYIKKKRAELLLRILQQQQQKENNLEIIQRQFSYELMSY